MSLQHVSNFLLLAFSCCVPIQAQENSPPSQVGSTLVVAARQVDLKLGAEVVATVQQGERYKVSAEQDEWLYVVIDPRPSQPLGGWIERKHVRLIHPVLALLEEGKTDAALASAAADYESLRGGSQVESVESTAALNRRGLAELAAGKLSRAVQTFREVAESRRRLTPSSDEGLVEALNNLGVALFREGRFAEARTQLTAAVQMRTPNMEASHPVALQSVLNLIQLDRFTHNEEPEWETLSQLEQRMLSKLTDGALGGPATAAKLIPMRSAEILHPTLKLSFSAPGYNEEPRLPEEMPTTAESIWWLEHLAELTGANEYFERWVKVSGETFGPTHLRTGIALGNLGARPKFPFGAPDLIPASIEDEQVRTLQRALRSLQTQATANRWLVAMVQRNLGVCLLSDPNQRPRGLQLLRESLRQFEQFQPTFELGIGHELLGLAAYIHRDYQTAAEHLAIAYDLEHEFFGARHARTTATLNSLGVAHYQLGNIEQARRLLEQALNLRQEATHGRVSDTLRSMNDLAVVLSAVGDYVTARQLFESSIAWLESQGTRNDDPWLVQQIEMNLWVLRIQMGDYQPAAEYFQRILKSEDRFAHLDALANLATLSRLQGNFAEAQQHLEAALSLSPNELRLANDLGAVLREQGEWQRAEQVLTSVVGQRAAEAFPDNDAVAFSKTSLALVKQRMGKYAAARELLLQVLEHCRAEFGSRSPRTIEVLRLLGQTELLADRHAHALPYLQEAFTSKLQLAADVLPSLSEAEALAYVVTVEERDALLEAFAFDGDTSRAYDVVWKTKALATRALSARARQRQRMNWSDKPALRELQARLNETRTELASTLLAKDSLLSGSWELEGVERIRQLSRQKEALERQLAAAGLNRPTQADTQREASVEDLVAQLPEGTAVVDFLRTNRIRQNGWHYEAFVVSPANIERIDLGPATAIDAAVSRFRSELVARKSQQLSEDDGGAQLRRLIWAKLERHLVDVTTVIVIPDGALTAVPWYALPSRREGHYLIEDLAIANVSYPHRILELLQPIEQGSRRTLLAGGIDYSAPLHHDSKQTFKPASVGGLNWPNLPGTAREINTIAKCAMETDIVDPLVLDNAAAGEDRLKKEMPDSRFIHLATHGFFADPDQLSATLPMERNDFLLTEIQESGKAARAPRVESLQAIMGRNPLVLSGVVLAGANIEPERNRQGAPLGGDGVLTAEEVAGLDLAETELVVLSACETGLGKVAGGEGVFGLQRAFAYAGARTTVSSLWKVDDSATATLMEEFYRNLWGEKMSKIEALRQAQLWMFREQIAAGSLRARGTRIIQEQPVAPKDSLPPYYWASFVLCGDWQ